jgi:multiple sugar transport system permease protein
MANPRADAADEVSVAVRKPALPRRRARRPRAEVVMPYLFLLPALALIGAVLVVPVARTLIGAFQSYNVLGQASGFAGLDNWRAVLEDPVIPAVARQTAIWTLAIVVVATPISVGMAVILNRRFPGRFLARAITFAPWAVSFVFVAIIWRFIFDPFYGFFNDALGLIGLDTGNYPWLGKPTSALAAVIWVGVQLTIPFTTIVTLAGLQSIPGDVVEAARVDGASGWQVFKDITLPLLKPILTVATLVNVIYIFNSFPIIWVMTGGGPVNSTDTVVTYLYKVAFQNNQYGEGAALSAICFAVLMVFSVLYVRFTAREEL